MASPVEPRPATRPLDFFISYTPADERWAAWVAWELEAAGYRTMLQGWDFVPGSNFIDFMDRGVTEAAVVIAILSPNYLNSKWGRLEWQMALRAEPDEARGKLVTVRIEECNLDGLLAMITFINLVDVSDPETARRLLLTRVEEARLGRAKPNAEPGYPLATTGIPAPSRAAPAPADATRAAATVAAGKATAPATTPTTPGRPTTRPAFPPAQPDGEPAHPNREPRPTGERQAGREPARRLPAAVPAYPRTAPSPAPRESLTVLHLAAPRIAGRPAPGTTVAGDLQATVWAEIGRLRQAGAPPPDLLVVAGDLTGSGRPRDFEAALSFLGGLRALLSLEAERLVLVPGTGDVNTAACRAYFENCDADDIEPERPYWPKWRHFSGLFDEVYQGVDGPLFDSAQPWSLFPVPDLKVVVAGLNSTIDQSHRDADRYGWLGDTQPGWFAEHLNPYEDAGWLRLGVVHHPPRPTEVPHPRNGTQPRDGTDPREATGPDSVHLRDTDAFDRQVAGHLNVLLTGIPGSVGPPGDPATSGTAVPSPELLIVPPPPAGHVALLTLTGEGFTRWSTTTTTATGDPERPVARTAGRRSWAGAAATFPATPPPAPGPGTPQGPGATQEPERGDGSDEQDADPTGRGETVDPRSEALDRIAEVCRARYDGASVRPIAGRVPHLLVTYREHGFIRQLRVGVQLGPLDRADLEEFIQHVHGLEPDLGSELVTDVPAPVALREEARRRRVRVRTFREFQGLVDLSAFVADQTTRLSEDPRYPPDLYVPQRYRELALVDRGVRAGLTDELLRLVGDDDGRFVLLLGDFGRGKTFALRELARRIPAERPGLVPIFVELRALDKAHSVDGLVAAHLANHGLDRIDLKAFRYMVNEGRIVLLFDGFDELVTRVTYDRAADHLETLLQAARGDAKIVVASRTHHFRTHAQVLTALGERVGLLPRRRVLSIEDFVPSQIRSYLANRYRGDTAAADQRLQLINNVQDLGGLARNPRMLSFIADLDADRLSAVAQARHTLSAAGLYREILTSWLTGEVERTQGVPGSPLVLDLDDLWAAVRLLALRLWESGEPFLRLAEIDEVADSLTNLAEGRLSTQQATHAMGAGSLLTRTEDGLFGFIHSSVTEWLVASDIAERFAHGEPAPAILAQRPLSQLSVDFVCDLVPADRCRAWATAVLSDPGADEITRGNALRVSARLRTPIRSDLRHAALRGEDLSYRELRSVDLTGADLTEARLVGADLRTAVLRDARLVSARLDGADLTGADLTGADLTRARLLGTTLTDVTATGVDLRQTAVVGAVADPALLADLRRRGAAVAPGQPVGVGLAPPAVGVSFGFEIGRIPDPVAYSPDGGILTIASEDGGVLVCDAASGQPLRTLHGHQARAYLVRCAGETLVSGSADRTVRVWEPATGTSRHTLSGHTDWVWPVELDADGSRVAVGDSSGTVRLWDTAAGTVRATFGGHATRVWTAAFHPAGRLLATGDESGTARLWDTATGELRHELPCGGPVYRLAFSPTGDLLVTGGDTGTVRLWDPASGALVEDLVGHEGAVYTVDFRPDGTLIATGDVQGVVRVWGRPGSGIRRIVTRHSGAVYRVRFSPDGSLLATGDSGSVLRLLDPDTGELRQELTGHRGSVWPMAFRPDGGQVATSSNDGTARMWDPATGACVRTLVGLGRRLSAVRFSPDGHTLATSGNDGTVRLWDWRTGRHLGVLAGVADRLLSVVFTPAGGRIAATSSAGSVHLWRLDRPGPAGLTGAAGAGNGSDAAPGATYERELGVETDHVWAEAFSPDGDMLATANDDDSVRLWFRSTGRHVRTFADHRGRVRSVAFSPDGTLLATGCDDRQVRLWNNTTGALVRTLEGHTDRVYSVSFSKDGRLLASASNDGSARLWEVATGRPLRTFDQHVGRLWAAAFSPDASVLATAGDDLVVRLWEPASGAPLATLTGHTRRIWSLAFSPDGTRLASCGDDGTARLWDVSRPAKAGLCVTLVAHDAGWAALAPDGGYKTGGDLAGEIWHVIGLCRFELGELDSHLDAVRRLPIDTRF